MSWYDFGRTKDNFLTWLPDGKETIDTGFYFQELMAMGGWYFHPVPGSGQRSFYNRVYISPSVKDKEDFKLDDRATMFINLAKTRFGKLEIKLNDCWLDDDLVREICENWRTYYDYIAEKVTRSYIVLYVGSRNHTGEMFNSWGAAMDRAMGLKKTLSANSLKKYGIQIFEPHTENPCIDTLEGVNL